MTMPEVLAFQTFPEVHHHFWNAKWPLPSTKETIHLLLDNLLMWKKCHIISLHAKGCSHYNNTFAASELIQQTAAPELSWYRT
jgi:hypothetical protein